MFMPGTAGWPPFVRDSNRGALPVRLLGGSGAEAWIVLDGCSDVDTGISGRDVDSLLSNCIAVELGISSTIIELSSSPAALLPSIRMLEPACSSAGGIELMPDALELAPKRWRLWILPRLSR